MFKQSKKIMSLILAILMVVSVTACQNTDQATSEADTDKGQVAADTQTGENQDASGDEEANQMTYTPGVYTSKQAGKDGDVEVIVTFDDHSIVSVEIGENNETEGIATEAFNRIPQAIVDNQSLGIDTVSGASVTSGAIIDGVADAVAQAGGDVEALKAVAVAGQDTAGETIEKEADIVIVGAGASGLTAGISASEAGAKVLILEKGVNAAVSNGAQAGGPIAAGTKVQQEAGEDLTVETLYQHMSDYGNGTINDALLKNVLNLSGETIDMLGDAGLHVYLRQDAYGIGFRARHGFEERLLDRTTPLTNIIEANGGEIMYETAGEKVLTDDNGIANGVEAHQADGTKVIVHAKAVLLATGGYLGNVDMIHEKFGNVTVNPLGNELSTGDGINMATAVGGVEDRNWGIVANEFSGSNHKAGPWSFGSNQNLRFGVYGGLMVNKEGNRFFNEEIMAERPLSGAESALRQGTYYAVIDQAYYDSVCEQGIFKTLGEPDYWVAGVRNLSDSAPDSMAQVKVLTEAKSQLDEAVEQGWAFKADTIEELADHFGLENLPETVANYNEMCANGQDTEFYKNNVFMTPVTEGPFYVFEYETSAWCTIGGVKVDDSLRVLDANNDPIPGLYAAGLDAGSMFTVPYYDNEGSAFGLSLASGTMVGRLMNDYVSEEE